MEKEQLFEQLTTLSRGFLTNSKDPLHDYYTHEYEKLRTHINLIVALKIKFKDAFSFNYTEINVTIKRSCQHPANKISTQFLSTRIAIPILSAIPPTAEEMEDILTFAGAVIYFSELREIAAQLFNILLKAQPAKTTEHLCKNITQTLNVQQQSTKLSNYISLLSLLDFGDNSEAIVKIISLLLPRASSYLSNKDCAALFTASIIQPLVYSEFEIDSSVCKEWYDEIKISRSKHVKDKDILKRLISLSIAVHSSSLLAKCGKHIPILSEGFKFPELTRPILHLVYRILSTKEEKIVKDHPIEAVINRLPVSTLAYPQLMCKVLEQFAAVKEINEQAHFEALSKSDFYECLIYHKNITDTMRKNLISRSIQTSRFDILAKVVNGKTIESVIPYFCELLQNGFSTHKLVKHITKDPKNIVTSIDVIFNKVHLFNDRQAVHVLIFLTELILYVRNLIEENESDKLKEIILNINIMQCNVLTFLFLMSASETIILLAERFAQSLYELYIYVVEDYETKNIFEIPIYKYISTYPIENFKKIFYLPQEYYVHNFDPSNNTIPNSTFFILLRDPNYCYFLYQLFLEVYQKSEKFKEEINKKFADPKTEFLPIKCYGIVSGYYTEYIPIIEQLIQHNHATTIYSIVFANENYLEEIVNQISISTKLTNSEKLIIYRTLIQKLDSMNEQTKTNMKIYKQIIDILLNDSTIIKEFISTLKPSIPALNYILTLTKCLHRLKNYQHNEINDIYNSIIEVIETKSNELETIKIVETNSTDNENNNNNKETTEIESLETKDISLSHVIFALFIELSCALANSDSGFDLKKCFFTLNKIIHNISIPICIEQLESLFAIASKQQFVFVECINSIQLTTFENCYIVGYFAIKNYELIKTDSHLALSIALALVTDNCIFPNCTDLLTLLSQIQWTSSSKPSLSRRRSAARVRKIPTAQQRTPEPAANSNQIPKENASRFIAGTVLNLTDVFIKVVVSIICSPGITPELCEKFVQVLMPWIKNLKLTSSSKFRYLFDPFFSNNCTEHVHYYIMRTIFPIFVDSQEMILNEFFRHNCKSNDYLIFYQFTDSKDKLIQFLESKILRLQKVQFFMQVLRHLQYLGSEEITDSKLLALMYPFFDNEDESIMKCVTNILEKCGTDKPSLKEIFEKKGEEFENEFLLNVISFLGYKMDTNVSNILFNYAKERAKQFTIEHMNQYINTMKRKKCHLQLLTQHFLSLYTLINEDIKPIIYEFAKFLIQTDHNEISKLAFDILKEKDGNDNLILQCIIRGTLTFDEIEPYVKLENLKKNYVFWYKMYKDMEINEEEFPEVDDLYCAVKYGSEELLQKIGNIIPDLINKGFRIQYLLNYLFDIDNLNISKIAPIFIAIPPQIYSFPKTGLEKPDLTIKLNIVLIKSREYRDFIHKFQIN